MAKHLRNNHYSEKNSETLFVHLTGNIIGMVQIQDIMIDKRRWIFLGGVDVGDVYETLLGR